MSARAGRRPLPRFGTDGVRGLANVDLTPEYALVFGRAAARLRPGSAFLVGRDTRRSGPLLEGALCAGLASEGAEVISLGVCPTPAVAWAAATQGFAGVVISASHNAFLDNGLKLFAPGGLKLSDGDEQAFQVELDAVLARDASVGAKTGADLGRFSSGAALLAAWQDSVVASIDGRGLQGLRIVVDCANGAAHEVGPAVLRRLGADVIALSTEPDGININHNCGSTHLEQLAATVRSSGALLGVAFDGDADRLLAVDAEGELIDGDQLIAMCARDLKTRGRLAEDTVVVTVMANQGFRIGMARSGIRIQETAVGDRYVLEALESGHWTLGGEQSGHVIFRDRATTGDGLLTAVQVLDLVKREGTGLAELADAAMTRLPQVLRNVTVAGPTGGLLAQLAGPIALAEGRLEGGRVLIRPSGTEPLLRVMVEAPDPGVAAREADLLVQAVLRLVAASSGGGQPDLVSPQ